MMSPMHLEYEILKDCVSLTYKNNVNGTWPFYNIKQHLWAHCLSKNTVCATVQHIVNKIKD